MAKRKGTGSGKAPAQTKQRKSSSAPKPGAGASKTRGKKNAAAAQGSARLDSTFRRVQRTEAGPDAAEAEVFTVKFISKRRTVPAHTVRGVPLSAYSPTEPHYGPTSLKQVEQFKVFTPELGLLGGAGQC